MKRRDRFSAGEADEIREKLDELRREDSPRWKRLRGVLRKRYRFYIMDFDRNGMGFSRTDFGAFADYGRIVVED